MPDDTFTDARRRRWAVASTAVVTLAALAGLTGPAAALPTEDQRFKLIFRADPTQVPGKVIAHGPVSGVGTVRVTSFTGGTFTSSYEFADGTLAVAVMPVESSFEPNPTSCTARITTTSEVRITSGTGSFAGAFGTGTATSRALIIGQRGPAGECLLPEQPARGIEIVDVNTSLVLPG